jgi:hypothetical protein
MEVRDRSGQHGARMLMALLCATAPSKQPRATASAPPGLLRAKQFAHRLEAVYPVANCFDDHQDRNAQQQAPDAYRRKRDPCHAARAQGRLLRNVAATNRRTASKALFDAVTRLAMAPKRCRCANAPTAGWSTRMKGLECLGARPAASARQSGRTTSGLSPDSVRRYRGCWWGTIHLVASIAGASRTEVQMNNVTQPFVKPPTEQPSMQDDRQREALEQSEKKATEQQPESFKDKATNEKVVEIGPDVTDAPIKGIDPPERPSSGR